MGNVFATVGVGEPAVNHYNNKNHRQWFCLLWHIPHMMQPSSLGPASLWTVAVHQELWNCLMMEYQPPHPPDEVMDIVANILEPELRRDSEFDKGVKKWKGATNNKRHL